MTRLPEPTRWSELGLPIGEPVESWRPAARPPRMPMEGRFCRVEPISVADHAEGLHEAFSADREGRIWTYLPYGPFDGRAAFRAWLASSCLGEDPLFHAIIETATGRPVGMASYLRIEPVSRVIEVGHINYAPALQRTPAATEAMWLMMRRVFEELGYRRYEWKCDALNAGSVAAARRLGFTFEGVFRQATMYKGRNRDTAWFAILDRDWPAIDRGFRNWLDEVAAAPDGRQCRSLAEHIGNAQGAARP